MMITRARYALHSGYLKIPNTYVPTGKVYIEYWGYENDPKYLARKQKKIELYKKYSFNLIELQDKDVQNLDDVLPKLLLKYGVQTY